MRRSLLLAVTLAGFLAGCAGPTPTSAPDPSVPPAGIAPATTRAEMLKRKIDQVPGWACMEKGNFLLLYDTHVKPARLAELVARLEALLNALREELPSDGAEQALFVVRVCKDKEQYSQYGGPGGSSGYWSRSDGEMVSYDDPAEGKARVAGIASLLVHAYLSDALDPVRAHPWFSHGLVDFYTGCRLDARGMLVPEPNREREAVIREAVARREVGGRRGHRPLKDFLRSSLHDFYGPQIAENAAEAWSFTWFLRLQRSPEWRGLLSRYYAALRAGARAGTPESMSDAEERRIQDAAWEAVFGGFDDKTWRRLERDWLAFR